MIRFRRIGFLFKRRWPMEDKLCCYRLPDETRKRWKSAASFPRKQRLVHQTTSQEYQVRYIYIAIYYIDTNVLLGNRPLVKFIRNYIRDQSGIFSISSPVRISMTSFPAFAQLSMCQTPVEKWPAIYTFVKFTKADMKKFTEE